MWPFSKKAIWIEIKREYLRQETDGDEAGVTFFKVWAVTYMDLVSFDTKIEEKWTLN
jgi:hypothetical protein